MKFTKNTPRSEARRLILEAATRHARSLGLRNDARYSMRHMQRCVCIVRRNRLLPVRVIVAAGYNAVER